LPKAITTGEGHGADQHADVISMMWIVCSAAVGKTVEVSMKLAKPMCRRRSRQAVHDRHQLGHLGHLDDAGRIMPMVPPTAIAATIQA